MMPADAPYPSDAEAQAIRERLRVEAEARDEAARKAFSEALATWAVCFAEYQSHAAADAPGDAIDRGRELAAAQMAAADALMRTPAPDLDDLLEKMLLIEREVSEAVQHDGNPRALIAWLALLRADFLRLLKWGGQ